MSSDSYRAIRLNKLSSSFVDGINSLSMETIQRPKLKDNQLRIKVYASCLNYFDLLILVGRYQYKPKLPYTMGSECAGVIIEVGSSVKSENWRIGDRVLAGMSFAGCMASEVVIDESDVIKCPKNISLAGAAALSVGFFTGYHALVHRGRLSKDDSLLVTGAGGGMGLSAIQLARALGCKLIIAAASTRAKADLALKYGAHHAIVYSSSSPSWKKEVDSLTGGKGVNVVYEVVGGKIFDTAFRCLTGGGRLLVVGFACGSIPSIPANLVLVKGIDVVGVRSGAEMLADPSLTRSMIASMHAMIDGDGDSARSHSLVPHLTKYTPDNFKQAYTDLNEARLVGKAAVIWNEEDKPSKL